MRCNKKPGITVLKLSANDYEIYEAKYYKKSMTLAEIHHEAGQVREIKALNVVRLGFVAVSGFEAQEAGYRYFDGGDLYQENI